MVKATVPVDGWMIMQEILRKLPALLLIPPSCWLAGETCHCISSLGLGQAMAIRAERLGDEVTSNVWKYSHKQKSSCCQCSFHTKFLIPSYRPCRITRTGCWHAPGTRTGVRGKQFREVCSQIAVRQDNTGATNSSTRESEIRIVIWLLAEHIWSLITQLVINVRSRLLMTLPRQSPSAHS